MSDLPNMQESEKNVKEFDDSSTEPSILHSSMKELQSSDQLQPQNSKPIDSDQATSTPEAALSTPVSDQEKKNFPFRFTLKKGVPTKNLETHLETWRMILVNMALLIAGFMVGLDQSIIAPAIPTIVAQFQSLHDIGTYQSAYLLPQCVLHPMCNKIYSCVSFSTAYIGSILIFGIGGLISATSTNSPALICGRAVSGIGAVGLSIGGFRLLSLLPESKKQNLSLGFFSMILGCSIVVGPIVGGAITTNINWHWIFWINLPVMGIVLVCVVLATFNGGPDLQGENADKPLAEKIQIVGWPGTFLFALTLVPFILALQFSQQHAWGSGLVIGMFVLSGVSLVAFIIQQRYTTIKIFDPAVALKRSVWATCGLFFSALSSVGVLLLFLAFLLQLVRGVSPQTSGYESFPLGAMIAVGTFIFATVSTLVPFFNPFALMGCTLLLVASCLFVALDVNFTIPRLVGYELLAGFGVGMSWLSEIIFPRAQLDKFQLAKSLGYSRMLQQIGATVSVQVATIVFTSRLKSELSFLGQAAEDISSLLGSGAIGNHKGSAVDEIVLRRAYSRAIRDGLVVAVVFAAFSLMFAIVLPWPRLKGGITHKIQEGQLENNDAPNELDHNTPDTES